MDIFKVQFRKDNLGVFAVFPYEVETEQNVLCYSKQSQHSSCTWAINHYSKQAKKHEYQDLLNELIQVYSGCILVVIKRRSHCEYLKAYYQSKRLRYASAN